MDTLYTQIKNREGEIEKLKTEHLPAVIKEGYDPKGKIPNLKDSAKEYLNDPKYDNNKMILAMREGRSVESLVGDVISQKVKGLNLPGRKDEREKYNKLVDELKEVVPGANRLKEYSIFAFFEGSRLINSLYWGIFVGGLGKIVFRGLETIENLRPPEGFSWSDGMGIVMGAVGVFLGYILTTSRKERKPEKLKESINEDVNYLDNIFKLGEK